MAKHFIITVGDFRDSSGRYFSLRTPFNRPLNRALHRIGANWRKELKCWLLAYSKKNWSTLQTAIEPFGSLEIVTKKPIPRSLSKGINPDIRSHLESYHHHCACSEMPTAIPCWAHRFLFDTISIFIKKSLQLSNTGQHQYLDGWPPGNKLCCRLLFWHHLPFSRGYISFFVSVNFCDIRQLILSKWNENNAFRDPNWRVWLY